MDNVRQMKTQRHLEWDVSIRVDADLTLVPVTVTDRYGRNVRGLGRQNFRVFDDTEQRPIVAFSREDAPVSIGLIFDASRSMRDKFRAARDAASRLFQQLNPEDEAFLVTVSDRAVLRHDFTSDLNEIRDAMLFAGPDLLNDLAKKTGGIAFLTKELNNFGRFITTIGVTLHNQYVLGYYPPDNAPSGKYRKIKVQLMMPPGTPPMQVYARTGYYTPQK